MSDIEKVLKEIQKAYGSDSIRQLGDGPMTGVDVIPTGSLALDIALGIGGFPKGRIIELYGWEGTAKSTIAQLAVANSQRQGGTAAYIDAEQALDFDYAEQLGVNLEKLIFAQPEYGEQALEMTERLLRGNVVDIIVVDSVAALIPKAELEGEIGDSKIGLHARLMSQAMRKISSSVKRSNTCLIFINQLRKSIGITYGNPDVTTGGHALKFYSSQRLEFRNLGGVNKIKNKAGEQIGNAIKVKVVKNKLAAPFKVAQFDLIYGEGVVKQAEVLDMSVELGLIDKKGSWYSYQDVKLGQGRDSTVDMLMDNPELIDDLKKEIQKHYGLPS